MIHCRQPSALIIECGRQSLTCLANQVEALLDGAEAGHLGVPRINGRPIVGGIENDVSAQSSALRNQLREVLVPSRCPPPDCIDVLARCAPRKGTFESCIVEGGLYFSLGNGRYSYRL